MTLARLEQCANQIDCLHSEYTLLDAGCRTMALKPLLKGCEEYFGTDLIPAEGVLQCDLEKRLPFDDNSFDIVTALDVLEHLENPHGALKELCRVARKSVMVSLPNMFYLTFRINYLLGHGISGKYRFEPTPVLDRHRWLLSYEEAVTFIYQNTHGYKVEHQKILPRRGRTRFISEPIEKWLGDARPNLFAYGVLFHISVNNVDSVSI